MLKNIMSQKKFAFCVNVTNLSIKWGISTSIQKITQKYQNPSSNNWSFERKYFSQKTSIFWGKNYDVFIVFREQNPKVRKRCSIFFQPRFFFPKYLENGVEKRSNTFFAPLGSAYGILWKYHKFGIKKWTFLTKIIPFKGSIIAWWILVFLLYFVV